MRVSIGKSKTIDLLIKRSYLKLIARITLINNKITFSIPVTEHKISFKQE
jgi:hypothetical protein